MGYQRIPVTNAVADSTPAVIRLAVSGIPEAAFHIPEYPIAAPPKQRTAIAGWQISQNPFTQPITYFISLISWQYRINGMM